MSKFIKPFHQFINESGNAIQDSIPFRQHQIKPTITWLEKNLFPYIGLEGIGIDASIIGSAGKKKDHETSGDIDLAISAHKVSTYLESSLSNLLFTLNSILIELGYSTQVATGFNQISIAVPIEGDYQLGVGQVDLMLSTDLKWSTFIYHSPDFTKNESQYKGAYRNLLLMSAIGKSFYQIISTTDDDRVKEYEAYVVRLNQGIVKVRKSFEGKNGLLKNAKLLKEFDQLITNEPQTTVDLLFDGDFRPEDINTYEKLKQLLQSPFFKFKKILPSIFIDFLLKISENKLPIPEDMQKDI